MKSLFPSEETLVLQEDRSRGDNSQDLAGFSESSLRFVNSELEHALLKKVTSLQTEMNPNHDFLKPNDMPALKVPKVQKKIMRSTVIVTLMNQNVTMLMSIAILVIV